MLLGRAELAANPTSNLPRVRAINAFRRAIVIAPDSLSVWDWYVRGGLAIGGADGERIVREGTEELLRRDPTYPDAWRNWLLLYRGGADRTRMRRILNRERALPEARARIARLYLEDERYDSANAILDELLMEDSINASWLALRAQSAFESGDSATGTVVYARALANADHDATILWQHAIGIATPDEVRSWEAGIGPEDRGAWLRAFWARRTPDLFVGMNQRVAEHFQRLRVARRRWPLQHPLTSWQRRGAARTLNASPSGPEEVFYQRCEAREFAGGPTHARDRARTPFAETMGNPGPPVLTTPGVLSFAGDEPVHLLYGRGSGDVRDMDTTAAAIGYNLRTGLDDRGLTYLRFGEPRQRLIGTTVNDAWCAGGALERWTYDDVGTVRFFDPSAVAVVGANASGRASGGIALRPMNAEQFVASAIAISRDATSMPASLAFGVWFAQFAGGGGATDLAVVTTRGALAAALVAPDGTDIVASQSEAGTTVLTAPPGRYQVLAHAQVGDTLGRQSLTIALRPMRGGMSDLLLASAWPDTTVTRATMLARVARDLVFPPGASLRVYAEVYGLVPEHGRARYRAAYALRHGGSVVTFAYDRDRPASGSTATEWLDLTPDRLPVGEYVLQLEVGGRRASIVFRIATAPQGR